MSFLSGEFEGLQNVSVFNLILRKMDDLTVLLKRKLFLTSWKRFYLKRTQIGKSLGQNVEYFDIKIQGIIINLKLTKCIGSDNASNKLAFLGSITGDYNHKNGFTWTEFANKYQQAKLNNRIKTNRHRQSELHYLVKDKNTGKVLFKPLFDIHTYKSNPYNDLQINWSNEFSQNGYCIDKNMYEYKIKELLDCIKESCRKANSNNDGMIGLEL